MKILQNANIEELSAFIKYYNSVKSDLCIIDDKLRIVAVSDGYAERHGCRYEDLLGVSVDDIEKSGVFNPSVGKLCYDKKKKVTILQKNKKNETILSTAGPVFDNDGNIKYILCYNAIDIADCLYAPAKFERVKEIFHQYAKINNRQMIDSIKTNELNSRSSKMDNILRLVEQISNTDANVVITGATGVGKSLLAKTIHRKSDRYEYPFVEVDCGSIPSSLFESEMFGYEKGAFTGADTNGKIGRIELADKGTLFLDEIAEMPIDMQVKLLKVIQEHTITRVGGTEPIEIDFRLIVATNRDLEKEVENGNFREDLFYRLNVIPIKIPSINERPEDVYPLVMTFLNQFNQKYSKDVVITDEAMRILETSQWDGNVRQIENLVERLVILSNDEVITVNDIKTCLNLSMNSINDFEIEGTSLKDMMKDYERKVIIAAYEKSRSSVGVAADLNISQTSASRKIREYIFDNDEEDITI